jgi:two-component system, OmpR family, alkaline phosphatase synthesis response regulator PhoP
MKKILIAEDDTFLANAYRVKLTKAGFEVKIVNDGQEAEDIIREFMPDLMILDLIMPVKDGFTTLKELRQDPAFANLPIVVASNLGQKEDIEKATGLGATDFLVKSAVKLEEVVQKINAILG